MSQLEPVIAPAIEAAGYRLVRLRLIGGKTKTLQIMAERPDGHMDVEDCARLSRALSDFLDREDPIEGEYVLEVSSPGIDRPLTRLTDFSRWSGHEAKLELNAPDATGRKRFKGMLLGLDGNDVVIDVEGQRLKFPFRSVAEAKLVLTDKLIQEDLKARKHSAARASARAGATEEETTAADPATNRRLGDRYGHWRCRKPARTSADRGRGRTRQIDR